MPTVVIAKIAPDAVGLARARKPGIMARQEDKEAI